MTTYTANHHMVTVMKTPLKTHQLSLETTVLGLMMGVQISKMIKKNPIIQAIKRIISTELEKVTWPSISEHGRKNYHSQM